MTGTHPSECWIIVDQQNRFYRRRLQTQRSCCVTIFSTQALAEAYIELIKGGLPEDIKLEARHYTWKEIVKRFSSFMTHALLDHRYGTEDGQMMPIA